MGLHPQDQTAFVETCVAEEVDVSSSWLVAEGAPKYLKSAPAFALKYNINDQCMNSTIKLTRY